MAIVFDGRNYALKKKMLLESGVTLIREKGTIPHLATILIGENKASEIYTNLKKKFLESIGCQVDVYNLKKNVSLPDILLLIGSLNTDKTIHGIMLQMPLPETLIKIINLIDPKKDVDGLKKDSLFLHPTSKAVLEILSLAIFETKREVKTVCVVGSDGMVGAPLVKELKRLNYEVLEINKNTKNVSEKTTSCDVIISATGVTNLITPEMVKDEAIVIDVGAPFGDIDPRVEEKVSFITPVPGGVGPVTITCLAENLIIASNNI